MKIIYTLTLLTLSFGILANSAYAKIFDISIEANKNNEVILSSNDTMNSTGSILETDADPSMLEIYFQITLERTANLNKPNIIVKICSDYLEGCPISLTSKSSSGIRHIFRYLDVSYNITIN